MEKKVLLTGFDPFGGETVNPSWEAVKRLNGAAECPPLSYPNKCRPFFISLLPYCARRSKSISLTLSSVSDRQAAECRSRRNGSRSISMRRAYRITKETSLSGKTFLKTARGLFGPAFRSNGSLRKSKRKAFPRLYPTRRGRLYAIISFTA